MTSSLDMIRGRSNIIPLMNNSGGALIAGDVCIQDTSGDERVTTTTSAASVLKVFVAAESIASGATGKFYESGYCPLVNVNSSVTRGRFLFTHTVAKQAAENATYGSGAFGKILKSGTTPSAIIYSATAQISGTGVTRSGSTTDGHLAVWNGSNADSIKDGGAAGGAPTNSYYVLGTADGSLSNGIVIPAMRYDPDIVPASPNAYDDEFGAASLDGKWTWLNQGSSTATLNSNSYLELAAQAEAASQVRGIYQATAGGTWRYRAKVCLVSTTYASYVNVGMFAREAGTGKIVTHGLMVNKVSNFCALRIDRWTDATTYATGLLETFSGGLMGYFELELAASNFICRYSLNGITYAVNYSATKTTDFTTAPDQVGLFASSFLSNTIVTNSCDWIRKVA